MGCKTMIKTETLENGYIKTYSDAGFYIHGGFPEGDYVQAIDPPEFNRIYTETDKCISEAQTVKEKAAAYDVLMGGVGDE